MEIRKIAPEDDLDAISRIYVRSWKAAYKGIVPQDYLDELPETKWSQVIAKSEWTSLVLIEDGEMIGASAVSPGRDTAMADWGEIISIYLLPEYFGKGYGKPLLKAAIAELKAMGHSFIYLWVLEENGRARAFYEKNGFTASPDRHVDSIGGKDLVEVRYIYYVR
jgi:GNAT superfamily N-acetyltransferase